MVEKSKKLSPKNTKLVEIISQALLPKSSTQCRSLRVCSNKGISPSKLSEDDIANDLSDISNIEVDGYLNNKKEFLLKKIAWEMMNPDYQKGKKKKLNTVKLKIPIKKTDLTEKTSITITQSENKKRQSSEINYDALEKLFHDAENSPKKGKLEKPVVIGGDQMEDSQQSSEKRFLKGQCFEEEPDWNEDYSNEDVYGGEEEIEEDDDEEDLEGIIW